MNMLNPKTPKPQINEKQRQLSFFKSPAIPFSELWQTLNKQSEKLQNQEEKLVSKNNDMAVKMCKPVFDLKRVVKNAESETSNGQSRKLMKQLNMIINAFNETLTELGYAMDILDQKKWRETDEDSAEMQDYIDDENLGESIIIETIIPQITCKGTVIQPARVIVSGPPRK